jgi:pyruvate/2-oxoacid:ferredoxin oxidoreductase beta subunit
MHCAFETAAITAAGMRYALDAKGVKDVTVVAWAGDGGTFDIGIQALSGTAERNDDMIYVCYDNEAYMNTGIQRSSATPKYVWTSTTPGKYLWKEQPKKMFAEIIAGHRIPYFATCSIGYPDDMVRKFKKAKEMKGFRCFHIFAPCPTGWRMEERYSIKVARLAVEANVFPLYEVEDGVRWKINVMPRKIPITEYFKLQGRFRHLTPEQIKEMQEAVDKEWEILLKKAKIFK